MSEVCEIRWIKAMGKVCSSPDGQPTGMSGIVLDITSERQALEKLEQMNFLKKSSEQLAHKSMWLTGSRTRSSRFP